MATAAVRLQIIKLARKRRRGVEVHYIGVDLFELRPCGTAGLTLKTAYRLLRTAGARVKLVPGDPLSALARTANSINRVDTIIIGHDVDVQSLARAWFYLPRMLATWRGRRTGPTIRHEPDVYREVPSVEMFQRAAARKISSSDGTPHKSVARSATVSDRLADE